MKQTKLFLMVAVLASTLWSCRDSARELSNAIPADAIMVMHFDTKALLRKADYKPTDNKFIKESLDQMKAQGGDAKMTKLLEDFLKNPNSASGINLLGDWFMYMDAQQTVGILWKMNDAKKFKQLLLEQASLPEEMLMEENGVMYMDTGGGAVVGWTKDKLLFLTNANQNPYLMYENPIDLTEILKKQLQQTEGISANKSFAKFLKDRKDISVYYSYDNIAALASNNPTFQMLGVDEIVTKVYERIGEDFKGMSLGGFISFEKGGIEANNVYYFADAEAEKRVAALIEQTTGELKGEQLKYFAEKPLFLISFALKGAGTYDYLVNLGLMEMINDMGGKELAEMGIDLKSLISNIEGDITFAFNAVRADEDSDIYPELTLFADLQDAQAMLDFIKAQTAEILPFEEIAENTYVVSVGKFGGYLGIKNNTLYLTNSEIVFENITSDTDAKNDFAKMAKGKTSFMFGNLSPLGNLPVFLYLNEEGQELANKGFSLLGDYHYATKKDMSGEGKFVINDKSRNSLAVITAYIDSVVTYVAQNF